VTQLLLTVAMSMGAGPDIDGKWLIVYAEEGSRRNTTWEQKVATMKGDTLSYNKEGEERTLKLKFGADQKLTATLTVGKEAGKELSGVFIAGQDYLSLSLSSGAASDAKDGGAAKSSGDYILILRRQR
jgi:hypothetical protein